MLQPVMHAFEAACKHLAFFRFSPVYIREKFLTRATNPPCNGSKDNYQALETYGDSILKLLASLFIYFYGEVFLTKQGVQDMTDFVASRVNNSVLSRIAAKDILQIIKSHPCVAGKWIPPYYIKAKPISSQVVSGSGTVADVTEAIIAATYLTHLNLESCCCLVSNLMLIPDIRKLTSVNYSLERADFLIGYQLRSIEKFYSLVEQDWTYVELFEQARKHMKQNFKGGCQVTTAIHAVIEGHAHLRDNLQSLQDLMYRFKNEKLLERALTPASESSEDSYQRLELLGDALLDCVVMCTTAQLSDIQTAEEASLIKTNTVRNSSLGKLSLLIGLPLYSQAIQNYPDIKTFQINAEIHTRKRYADLLEAAMAAVFADSGSLFKMCEVFGPLFLPLIVYHLKFQKKIKASSKKGKSEEEREEIPWTELLD